jgi:HAMP domain-containing protein
MSIALALVIIPPMVVAAYYITAHETANLEKITINTAKIAAMTGARMYGQTLEAAIDSGELTINDVFDTNYEEIKGFDFGENTRYHTKYDFYTDRAVRGFQDKIVESSPDFMFALGIDDNGYLPTHNSRFERPLTGDRAKDLTGFRSKRKFSKETERARGHELDPVLIVPYPRDTGEDAWDVSVPIYVKGRHWGGFQVAVSSDTIASHKHALILQLVVVFGALAAITIGFIFVMLGRSMRPLRNLAELADEISIGDKLDQPIKPSSTDEIGQMAKSLNRLRSSMQTAMERLGL